jgi:DNA-binding CsgD family transcriptional regulator
MLLLPPAPEIVIYSDNQWVAFSLRLLIHGKMPLANVVYKTPQALSPGAVPDKVDLIIGVATTVTRQREMMQLMLILHRRHTGIPKVLLYSQGNSFLAAMIPQVHALEMSCSVAEIYRSIAAGVRGELETCESAGGALLTQRQFETLLLLGRRRTTHSIAAKMGISIKTVSGYRREILRRFNIVDSRVDYALLAECIRIRYRLY